MTNGQMISLVAGTAALGLLIGSLASRRAPPPDSSPHLLPSEAKQLVDKGESNSRQTDSSGSEAPRPRKVAKKAEERKNIELHSEDPQIGPESAKVTIFEFSDFQCPHCAKAAQIVHQLVDSYGEKVRLVFKHHPLPAHSDAFLAHEAAAEANAQGRFWEFHDHLFGDRNSLGRDNLESYAQSIGMDMARFRTALDNGTHKKHIEKDIEQATALGAKGTPAFFINGRPVLGARSQEAFRKIIDEELAH